MLGFKINFVVIVVWMAVVEVALFSEHAEAVISCSQVQGGLYPCLGFLQGRALVAQCCAGVKALAAAAKTPIDRRTACRCLQSAARTFKGINLGNAAVLPAKCGVNIPYKISPSTDCSRVR